MSVLLACLYVHLVCTYGCCELPCGCWEPDSDPLQEQSMVLPAEPSLQSKVDPFKQLVSTIDWEIVVPLCARVFVTVSNAICSFPTLKMYFLYVHVCLVYVYSHMDMQYL
jgi:hypothetical protein